jgi:hypothetical protein
MLLVFLFLSYNYSPDFILVMPNIIILFNIFLTITDQMISYFTVMSIITVMSELGDVTK